MAERPIKKSERAERGDGDARQEPRQDDQRGGEQRGGRANVVASSAAVASAAIPLVRGGVMMAARGAEARDGAVARSAGPP
ncbi:MAG: hypothetical protein HC857_11055 [Synechococcales cyanobacterium RU_4_20]|nr:hypothetical protein [Synechococcales cyanobacterium RU_4_20]